MLPIVTTEEIDESTKITNLPFSDCWQFFIAPPSRTVKHKNEARGQKNNKSQRCTQWHLQSSILLPQFEPDASELWKIMARRNMCACAGSYTVTCELDRKGAHLNMNKSSWSVSECSVSRTMHIHAEIDMRICICRFEFFLGLHSFGCRATEASPRVYMRVGLRIGKCRLCKSTATDG